MTPNEAAVLRAHPALPRPAAALGRLAAHGSVDGDSGAEAAGLALA